MILRRVISGFQTGSDIGGIRAAKAFSLETGGWMPRGYLTEDGPRPEYAGLYGAAEHESRDYPTRTRANAADSDATIWFGQGDSRGFGCTMNACRAAKRPVFKVLTRGVTPIEVAEWIALGGVECLNVAGNRESTSPGIGDRVELFMGEVLRLLA